MVTDRSLIEVVVVTRNSAGHIGACVDSMMAGGGSPIMVDNGFTDDTSQILRAKCPEARITVAHENFALVQPQEITDARRRRVQ